MNPVEKISRLFSTNRFRGSLGGTILAAIGLFPAIRDAFATGKSGLGVGYILLIPLAFYGLWKTIPADPHPIAEQTELFKPFQELKPEDTWPRKKAEELLVSAITTKEKSEGGGAVFLVGSSGVGKSQLLEQIWPKLEELGWVKNHLKNYNEFASDLERKLNSYFTEEISLEKLGGGFPSVKKSNSKIVFIFDHFEQFLSFEKRTSQKRIREKELFKSYLHACKLATHITIKNVIVVRKEFYHDLKFLGELVPSPAKSIALSGITIDELNNENSLREKLDEVVNDPEVREDILKDLTDNAEILPVEAMIVGCMIEREKRRDGFFDHDKYTNGGRKEGLIKKYFDEVLDASPNRNISLAVLFTLGAEADIKKPMELPEIAKIINTSSEEVKKILKYFSDEKTRLIREVGKRYELAHDYVAKRAREISGVEMDATLRDNIRFFSSRELPPNKNDFQKRFVFSDYFMIFLGLLLTARLFAPVYHINWGWFNVLSKYQSPSYPIDFYYLPVFLSHAAWSYYVTMFYRRFFSHLEEGAFGRLVSKLTVILCTACVTAAVFFPYCWLLSIGVGGLGVGFKLAQLYFKHGLSNVARHWIGPMAIKTIINLVGISVVGILPIRYFIFGHYSQTEIDFYNTASIYTALAMTWFMIHVSSHISLQETSILLGLYERSSAKQISNEG